MNKVYYYENGKPYSSMETVFVMRDNGIVITTVPKDQLIKRIIGMILDANEHVRQEYSKTISECKGYTGRELKDHWEKIIPYLPVADQNKSNMYGNTQRNHICVTKGHMFIKDVDEILERPELFLYYCKMSAQLIAKKYDKTYKETIYSDMRYILNDCKYLNLNHLNGIFAYETLKRRSDYKPGKTTFFLPVPKMDENLKPYGKIAITIDNIGSFTTFSKTTRNVYDDTVTYLIDKKVIAYCEKKYKTDGSAYYEITI